MNSNPTFAFIESPFEMAQQMIASEAELNSIYYSEGFENAKNAKDLTTAVISKGNVLYLSAYPQIYNPKAVKNTFSKINHFDEKRYLCHELGHVLFEHAHTMFGEYKAHISDSMLFAYDQVFTKGSLSSLFKKSYENNKALWADGKHFSGDYIPLYREDVDKTFTQYFQINLNHTTSLTSPENIKATIFLAEIIYVNELTKQYLTSQRKQENPFLPATNMSGASIAELESLPKEIVIRDDIRKNMGRILTADENSVINFSSENFEKFSSTTPNPSLIAMQNTIKALNILDRGGEIKL